MEAPPEDPAKKRRPAKVSGCNSIELLTVYLTVDYVRPSFILVDDFPSFVFMRARSCRPSPALGWVSDIADR